MVTAAAVMAKKKGRPKAGGRITFRYSVVATPEYQAWMNSFREFLGKQDVSEVFRESVRQYAVEKGFRLPPIL